jgi:hypothetical protein
MAWDLSVPDWRERIRTGRSLLPSLPDLDRAQADRAIKIFNKLRLPDVPGTPALADAGRGVVPRNCRRSARVGSAKYARTDDPRGLPPGAEEKL